MGLQCHAKGRLRGLAGRKNFVSLQQNSQMLIKSRALVLVKLKYNDSSEIVHLFTEAEGCVAFIVRVPKTRRAGVKNVLFQPLNLLRVEWDHRNGRQLQRLRSVEVDYAYHSLSRQPMKVALGSFVSEFLYHALRNERANNLLYEYLYTALQWLDMAPSGYANFHLALMLRVSRFLGIFPNGVEYTAGMVFDLQGAIFSPVLPAHPHYVPAAEAALVPRLLRMDFYNMHLYPFSRRQRVEVLEWMNTYYRLHLPGFPRLKSIEILREVFD